MPSTVSIQIYRTRSAGHFKNDILIIMGDFNARMGSRKIMNHSVMGTYGFRQRTDRGECLLDLYYANDLSISSTKFMNAKP